MTELQTACSTGDLPTPAAGTIELEAKLLLADGAEGDVLLEALARLVGLAAEPSVTVTDSYLDSRDLALYDAGFGCRIRTRSVDGGSTRWTLECKAVGTAGGTVQRRQEVTQVLPGETDASGLPRHGAARLLLDALLPSAPGTILQLVSRRRRWRATLAHQTLEVSLDHVEVLTADGTPAGVFDELEIELADDPPGTADPAGADARGLEALLVRLAESVPLRFSRLGKFERALWLIGTATTGNWKGRANDASWRLLQYQLRRDLRFIALSREVALEGLDPEGVHRLRTHVRRLRATLATSGDWLGGDAKVFSQRFRALADAVGEMRDHDVYARTTLALLADLPDLRDRTQQHLETLLEAERARIHRSVLAFLGSPEVVELVPVFRACIDRPPTGPIPGAGELADRALGRRARSVRKALAALVATAPDAKLHELRIRVKKLRYVLELFDPVLGGRFGMLAGTLRRLQDLLGDHQDACVAVARGQQLIAGLPLLPQNRDLLVTFGRLQREREQAALALRAQLLARQVKRQLVRQLRPVLRSP